MLHIDQGTAATSITVALPATASKVIVIVVAFATVSKLVSTQLAVSSTGAERLGLAFALLKSAMFVLHPFNII